MDLGGRAGICCQHLGPHVAPAGRFLTELPGEWSVSGRSVTVWVPSGPALALQSLDAPS
jgi:hypothetical protein